MRFWACHRWDGITGTPRCEQPLPSPAPPGITAKGERFQQPPAESGAAPQVSAGTLNTLIWQLAECRCSVYSPLSFSRKVSICTRNGTPFSPPCLRRVNSVLMQCTCAGEGQGMGRGQVRDR